MKNEVVNGGVTIILFVVTNLVCAPKKRNLSTFRGLEGAWKYIRTFEWKWKRDVTPVSLEMIRSLAQEEGVDPYHFDLVLISLFFLRIPSRALLLPVSNRTCWAKSSSCKTYFNLDRENRTVFWNHVLWLESVVNPISDRSSWQLNPTFSIIFVSVIVRKEGPTPSSSRIVALSFSTFCLRISQFSFSMGARGGI